MPQRGKKHEQQEDFPDADQDEKLIAPDDFDEGSVTNRRCTDCGCGLLLILVWLVSTAVGVYALKKGDYRLAALPLDYDGNVCGMDFKEDMTDYPYLLYVNSYTGGVCVKECPQLSGKVKNNVSDIRTLVTYGGMWQSSYGGAELPLDFVEVAPSYVNSSDVLFCTDSLCYPDNSSVASWHAAGVNEGFGFAYYVGDTYEFFWRCYLTSEAQREIQNKTLAAKVLDIPGPNEILLNLYTDVWTTKEYVFGFGFGVSLGVSFLYVFLMRLPCLLSIMIWGSIVLTWAMFGAAGYFSWVTAIKFATESPKRVSDEWIHMLYGVSVMSFLLLVLVVTLSCCMRQQIHMSIGCVRTAARAINRMPGILIVPVLQSIAFIVALAAFAMYGVHLASMGTISTLEIPIDIDSGAQIAVRTYGLNGNIKIMAWFLLFSAFWTSNFIVAVGDLIVAMCVARWYFTKDKRRIGSGVVLGSVANTLFYHLGTLAFGSLLIAIVQLIRVMLERLRRIIKNADNKVANSLICCCQCCFCILEGCLKYMNKNAYIQTAIFGTSFCSSSSQAFYLMVRNAGRVGVVSYVSSSILVVGKVFISTVTTGLSYIALIDAIMLHIRWR
jgi:Plasma-membrane choline transporter